MGKAKSCFVCRCPNWQEKNSNHCSICPHKQAPCQFFEQSHSALYAYKDGRRVILGGDLNLQIDVGKRGEQFASFRFWAWTADHKR